MNGDPYEEADRQQSLNEAKLVTPQAPHKNRKAVMVGAVLVGAVLGIVIIANVAGLVTGHLTPDAHPAPKPTTLTRQQSNAFADQQAGQADYMRGADRDSKLRSNEDTVLGKGNGLAADAFDEADGVPKKTKAQDDAERGNSANASGAKSEAQQRRETSELERQHRRQNDLNSSPVSLDFSDYFAKEKDPAAVAGSVTPEPPLEPAAARPRHSAIADALSAEGEPEPEAETVSVKKQAHDPAADYTFDSSFGKLYRLMEDTVLETVLVNRLTGASVGPVITMVTTDVYSASGSHLLIPKGTRLLGRVSAVGSLNQERLFVAFHRMIMPDGYSVSLDKFQGLDVVGQAGLRDLVNHHYVQIFGASLALAAVAATAQIGNNSSYATINWGTQMRNGVSEGLAQSAQRVLERFINVLPTFTIRERAQVKVMLAGDLLLPDTWNHTMDPDL